MGIIQVVYAAIVIAKIFGVEPIGSWPWWAILIPLELTAAFMAFCLLMHIIVRWRETPDERANRKTREAILGMAEAIRRGRV